MVKLSKFIMICLSRSKEMPPKRDDSTTNSNAGKTSYGSAPPRQRDGGKSGYSTIPCNFEKDGRTCKRSDCTFFHTKKENIPMNSGAASAGGGGAVARPPIPQFDEKSHRPVPNPEEALFREFRSSQMKVFHDVLAKGIPELFKTLLSKDGAFEAIGCSFGLAKDYDAFIASLNTFGVSIEELKKFIKSNSQMFFILEENIESDSSSEGSSDDDSSSEGSSDDDSSSEGSSDDDSSSEDSSDDDDSDDDDSSKDDSSKDDSVLEPVDYQTFSINFLKLVFDFMRGSVSEEDIRIYFMETKPAGTYKTFVAQLSAFYEDLKTFIQSVEQSWDEINRAVLKVEKHHVPHVEQSVQIVHDVAGLKSMLQLELAKFSAFHDEESRKFCEVLNIWLEIIRKLSGVGIPLTVLFNKELLTNIGKTVPAVKEYLESAASFKKQLGINTELDRLRSLNLSSLCGGNVQRADASNVVSSCCLAFSVLKGGKSASFSGWSNKLDKKSIDMIRNRFGDFFNLLQVEFLRMLSKKKNASFFELLYKENLVGKEAEDCERSLQLVLDNVYGQFTENVSSSQEEVLKILTTISKHNKEFKQLFDILFSVVHNGKNPMIMFKEIDYLIKIMKMIFGESLKIDIRPTGASFYLTYGLSKDADPVDVTETLSMFLLKMLYLNKRLDDAKIAPFSGNLVFDRNTNVLILDNGTVSNALTLTLEAITGNRASKFSEVFSSQHDRRARVEMPHGEECPTRVRFQHFLDRLLKNCVSEKILREKVDDEMKCLQQQVENLFSAFKEAPVAEEAEEAEEAPVAKEKAHVSVLNLEAGKALIFAILSTGYKPSRRASMSKYCHQGIRLFSGGDKRVLEELASFVATPFDELETLMFPLSSKIFKVIETVVDSSKDKTTFLTEFYKSLWKVQRFILSNISTSDMSSIYLLYTNLEFFNASSKSNENYTFKCCFPYTTHFFCALVVALQNHGLSLGDALKLLSSAIVNPVFKQTWPDKGTADWVGKASFVASSDFLLLDTKFKQNKRRTVLDENAPFPIKSIVDGLLSQTVTDAPEDIKAAIKDTVFVLYMQDTLNDSPEQMSLLNTMFSFLSMALSPKSAGFFGLYGIKIDVAAIQVCAGNGGTCSDAFLRTILPSIRAKITAEMRAATLSIRAEDQKCLEASSALKQDDIKARFTNIRSDVVLSEVKKLIAQMGVVSMSSIEKITKISEVKTFVASQQSFVDETFVNNLVTYLFRFAFSYRDTDKEAYENRRSRRRVWEEREAARAAAQAASQIDEDAPAAVPVDVSVDAPVAVPIVVMSSDELYSRLSNNDKDMFDAYSGLLITGTGFFYELLRQYLLIKDIIPRNARYSELCRKFPKFFKMEFLSTCFEIESFSDSELVPEFVQLLKNKYEGDYSSKAAFCCFLDVEQTEQVGSYLDACFREIREKVQVFIKTQPQLAEVRLPESFPDTNEDEAEASDDDSEADDSESSDDDDSEADSDAEADDEDADSEADSDADDEDAEPLFTGPNVPMREID